MEKYLFNTFGEFVMRNLVTLIAVIALTALPALAQTVDITLVDNGDGSFTIGYAGATEEISGVSMRVTLSGGDGELASCGDAVATDPDFNTHIDYWNTTGGTPVLSVGCPVGDELVAGLPTFPATVFAISTGVLEDPPGGADAPSGTIATITLTGTTCTTVALDMDVAGRGGVVGTSGDELVATFPSTVDVCFGVGDCWTGDAASRIVWESAGSPECWCYPTQCHGDADGLETAATKTVPAHFVGTPDLTALSTAWKVATGSMTPAMMCADFDHAEIAGTKTVPAHRVGTPDLTILSTYWKDAATPTDCLPGTVTP